MIQTNLLNDFSNFAQGGAILFSAQNTMKACDAGAHPPKCFCISHNKNLDLLE
jgi:hypothetical protein